MQSEQRSRISVGLLIRPRSLVREAFDNLPAAFFAIEALSVLHFVVANVPASEYAAAGHRMSAYAWTAAFPLFWVTAYYLLRARDSERLRSFGARRYIFAFIPTGVALALCVWYAVFPFFRLELPMASLTGVFEALQIFWIGVFVVHVARKDRIRGLLTFFVIGGVYGLILENGGIIMGYFFEPQYRLYLGRLPAPVVTMAGWCFVFYASIRMAEFFKSRLPGFCETPLKSAILTTAIAVSFDLQIDPIASLSGLLWGWNALLPAWFLAVPFVNYVAWFSAFIPFAIAYFVINNRSDINDIQRVSRLAAMIPNVCVAAAVLFFGIMAVAECGFSGPTYRILSGFFDGVLPY